MVDIFRPSIPLFGRRPTAAGKMAEITVPHDLKFARRARRRQFLNMLKVANAAKHLERLPAANETFHCVMRGNYHAWDLVPAVLRLAAPATMPVLYIATLGFNRANAAELLALINAGQIGKVGFICSCYYQKHNPADFAYLADGLAEHGGQALAMRSHAKIQAMKLSDGRHITIESSANLRSCHNAEQFSMTNDRNLFEFHASWISQALKRGGRR